MHIKLKFILLIAIGIFSQQLANGQILGPYPTGVATPQFEVDANGTLYSTGTYGTGSLPSALTGSTGGTWMFWYPHHAAFRAGEVTGTDWQEGSMGNWSAAFGEDTIASNNYCFAAGYGTTANQKASTAFGYSTVAEASYATAFGISTYSEGNASTSFGRTTYAYADNSISAGINTHSDAYCSVVVGRYNTGGGSNTTWVNSDPLFEVGSGSSSSLQSDAFEVFKNGNTTMSGINNTLPNQTLTGSASILNEGLGDGRYLLLGATDISFFSGASATGTNAVALGANTTAAAYESAVFGRYNVGGGSGTSWTATDPLFELGNGTSTTASDALVVYKNGNVTVQGTITASTFVTTASPATGDIPMFGH